MKRKTVNDLELRGYFLSELKKELESAEIAVKRLKTVIREAKRNIK